jgi:hypothetical protein
LPDQVAEPAAPSPANSANLPAVDLRRPTALALAAVALVAVGCGDEETTVAEEGTTTAPTQPTAEAPKTEPKQAEDQADEPDSERKPEPKPKPTDAEKQSAADEATAAYTDYIEAIDAKDGEALCSLLPPGVEREIKAPVQRGDCASTLAASIGYEDPRGFPVWTGTTLNSVQRAAIGNDPSTARLTAMIVTEFEGREPSVESDIAYLELADGRWRLAQPTGALYRAIGNPELPPTVIAPPG